MRLLAILALAVSTAAAYKSVTFPSSSGVQMTVPNVAPFPTLGDQRISFRLDTWAAPSGGNSVVLWQSAGAKFLLYSNSTLCAYDLVDTMSTDGNGMCVSLTGVTDVTVRYQRFGATYPSATNQTSPGSISFEAVDQSTGNVLPSYCSQTIGTNQFGCPIDTANTATLAGTTVFGPIVSSSNTGYSLAWIKWWSSTVAPGSPLESESTAADLADFRFEGNYTNAGTGGYALTMAASTGSPTTSATSAIEHPLCGLTRQYFAAGASNTLQSHAVALDTTGTLSYAWSQTTGSPSLSFSSTSIANPILTGASVLGSYTFQLVVTDGSSSSTTCSIKDGFVPVNGSHIVTPVSAAVGILTGPLVQMGSNPWGWYDDRDLAEAALQLPMITGATDFGNAFWNAAAAGTLTVTNGSATVTGSGTAFDVLFCGGSGQTAPTSGVYITIWYPLSGVPGSTGRRSMGIASCGSATSLTLTSVWNPSSFISAGSGLSYSYGDSTLDNIWSFNPSPANFYDVVAALYSLYYRSGIDDYLTAARTLADNFWQYRLDSGRDCFFSESLCPFGRNRSPQGMILRALDGRSDMWAGLEIMANFDASILQGNLPWPQNGMDARVTYDPREVGYAVSMISYAALFDPTTANQAAYRAGLANILTNGILPSVDVSGAYGLVFYWANSGGGGAPFPDSWEGGTSVSLTHGSTAVTCSGSCNFQGGWFNAGVPWWFTNTAGTRPTNNSQGDSVVYFPTIVDSTHATLDRPYQGTTGTHGWAVGSLNPIPSTVGFGAQPYTLGILGMGMDFASKAMACTGVGVPTNCSNANSTSFAAVNVKLAQYVMTTAYRPLTGGLYYFTGFINCQPPISDTNTNCTQGYDIPASRSLSMEAMRGIMTAVANSGGNATLYHFADQLYTRMWGKPGFSLPANTFSDGHFIDSFQDGNGFYMTGAPPTGTQHKYFGMGFGTGAGAAWPGYRTAGFGPIHHGARN